MGQNETRTLFFVETNFKLVFFFFSEKSFECFTLPQTILRFIQPHSPLKYCAIIKMVFGFQIKLSFWPPRDYEILKLLQLYRHDLGWFWTIVSRLETLFSSVSKYRTLLKRLENGFLKYENWFESTEIATNIVVKSPKSVPKMLEG
jgi:hypothetical protein